MFNYYFLLYWSFEIRHLVVMVWISCRHTLSQRVNNERIICWQVLRKMTCLMRNLLRLKREKAQHKECKQGTATEDKISSDNRLVAG